MAIAVADLISRTGHILQDEDNVRWEVPELIEWINDAARETIVRRPAAGAVTAVLTLVAGTKQSLPPAGIEFLDLIRNMASDGVTPGRSVRRVDRQLLDDQMPDWHTARAAACVRHFTYDERAPQTFYVYPPAKDGIKVEALYSQQPTAVTQATDTLEMQNEYQNVLVEYVVYRALSKDSEYANGTVAALHYQAFSDAVSGGSAQTTANSPNANSV